jgi:hypothetical protein
MQHQSKVKPLPKFLRETIYPTRYWSTLLEVLSDPQHRDYERVVDIISPLLDKGPTNEATREAVQRFNHWFEGQPETWGGTSRAGGLDDHVREEWDPDGEDLEVVPADDIFPSTYAALKAFLQSTPSRPRLKRCAACQRFFFDCSKNRKASYDTPGCASRLRMRKHRRTLRTKLVDK